jgi:hypothetical protein
MIVVENIFQLIGLQILVGYIGFTADND